MNQKLKLILGLVLLVLLIVASVILYNVLTEKYSQDDNSPVTVQPSSDSNESGSSNTSEEEKISAPDFSVEDAEGNTVKLSDFLGKPVVVNFWATWCPYCLDEMPDFDKAAEKYDGEVVFMMVNSTDGMRETKEKAMKHVEEEKYSFPVYYDTTLEASKTYGISSLPSSLFIDKDGYVISGVMGKLDNEAITKRIEAILPPATSSIAE